MNQTLTSILVVGLTSILAVGFASSATAEETIFDEENEEITQPVSDDDGSTEESIFDSDNAAYDNPDAPNANQSVVVEDDSINGSYTASILSEAMFDTSMDGGGEDITEWYNRGEIGLKLEPSLRWKFVAGGVFEHWLGGKENQELTNLYLNPGDTRFAYSARLGDTYVGYQNEGFSARIGNAVVRWGSTDLSRPGDIINPVDATRVSGSAAFQRLPQPMIDMSWGSETSRLQAVVVPFFVRDTAWVYGRDTALLNPRNPLARGLPIDALAGQLIDSSITEEVQPLIFGTQEPDETLKNFSGGLRGTTTFLNTDAGLGYFLGFDRTPSVTVDEDLRELLSIAIEDGMVFDDFDLAGFIGRNPQILNITQKLGAKNEEGISLFEAKNERLHTFLIDAARYVGPIGVRTDVAFHPEKTFFTTALSSVRRPQVSAAVGLSYENIVDESDAFTVTVETTVTNVFAHDSGLAEFFVNEAARGDADTKLLFNDGLNVSIAGALLWQTQLWDLGFQVGGLTNPQQGDWIGTAAMFRRWSPTVRTTLGVQVFEGPPLEEKVTAGGLFDHNDNVSLSVEGVF